MHCCNCFHNNVCGSSSPYNDVSMCKQFIKHGDVLCGSALQVVTKNYEELEERVKRLRNELKRCEVSKQELEREAKIDILHKKNLFKLRPMPAFPYSGKIRIVHEPTELSDID